MTAILLIATAWPAFALVTALLLGRVTGGRNSGPSRLEPPLSWRAGRMRTGRAGRRSARPDRSLRHRASTERTRRGAPVGHLTRKSGRASAPPVRHVGLISLLSPGGPR